MPYDNKHQGGPNRGRQSHHGYRDAGPTLDTSAIRLKKTEGKPLDPKLFDTVAHEAAKVIGQNEKGNKASQIRQFYDELVMWEEKVRQTPEKFDEYLPFIRMINAKAAYAQGRKNVDQNFTTLISHCLAQVDSVESLRNFKLFFEAFLGFFKLENPKG
jgi:CRISPR-associated protein Csm2